MTKQEIEQQLELIRQRKQELDDEENRLLLELAEEDNVGNN